MFELPGAGLSRGQRSERTAVGSSTLGEYLFCECMAGSYRVSDYNYIELRYLVVYRNVFHNFSN